MILQLQIQPNMYINSKKSFLDKLIYPFINTLLKNFFTYLLFIPHILLKKTRYYMKLSSNLYALSTIAYQLSGCLTDEELSILSANLVVLSDMLANILVHKSACNND